MAVNRAVYSQGCRLARAGSTDSATMRQARRSSSAMLAKYTGWGTALGHRAGENRVKRTAGDQGRETPAQPAAVTVPPEPADHRRTGLRAPVPHRSGTARRGLRLGAPDPRAAGPAHLPRPHPGDERRELPPKGSRENTVSQPLDQPDDA